MPIPANHIIPPAFILTPVEWRPEIMKRRGIAPQITADQCIRCGQCVAACPSFVIDLGEKQAEAVRAEWCLGCGHCGAVCPTEAILQEATSSENCPGQGSAPAASPETLGLLLRERRSVRKYKEDAIPRRGQHSGEGRRRRSSRESNAQREYPLSQSPLYLME